MRRIICLALIILLFFSAISGNKTEAKAKKEIHWRIVNVRRRSWEVKLSRKEKVRYLEFTGTLILSRKYTGYATITWILWRNAKIGEVQKYGTRRIPVDMETCPLAFAYDMKEDFRILFRNPPKWKYYSHAVIFDEV